MTSPVRVGTSVPDFTLETYDPAAGDFAKFSLADAKKAGRWTILFFYPADFTFVCATEFAALAEKHAEFHALGADVVTVSRDTKFVHLAWQRHEKELEHVKYRMGADVTGSLGREFGVLDEGSGLTLRGTYIVNPEGTLVASEVNFYNVGRNVDELLRKFKACLHVSKMKDEACPAKWKDEGDKTLKPSAKMVGKVHEALRS